MPTLIALRLPSFALLLACAGACDDASLGGIDSTVDGWTSSVIFSNGDADAREFLSDQLRAVPEPLAVPEGADPLRVALMDSRAAIGTEWEGYAFGAAYARDNHPVRLVDDAIPYNDAIEVGSALLPGSGLDAERTRAFTMCGVDVSRYFYDEDGVGLTGVLTHESAHRFSSERADLVRELLALRFEGMQTTLFTDPDVLDLINRMVADDIDEAEICRLGTEFVDRMVALGFPVRFPMDSHATDGGEYFAIAIELMYRDPEGYCASFSDEEHAFIGARMADVVGAMPRRPSCL